MTQYLKPPPGNPLVQLLAAVGAVAGLVISFILGFFVLAIIAGVVIVGVIIVGIRMAWLRRRWRQNIQETDTVQQAPENGETLEAEFEVISRRRQ